MASEPVPPLLGKPTLGPGWLEMTAPALAPLPPLVGVARGAPASSGAPRPGPLRPEPPARLGGGGTTLFASAVLPALLLPAPAPESEGGGGTTLGAPSAGADAGTLRFEVLEEPAIEGGGATTLGAGAAETPLRVPRGRPPALTAGGGATTLAASEVPAASLGRFSETAGGGGTTSVGPKSFPITLLRNDPLADCVGGGGTTVFEESGMLPLEGRRMSCATSAEGGGAITAGAGMLNFELRAPARSGADTGGGITAGFVICTGGAEISRLTPPGTGGMTLAASAGVARG
jgi:hypothetical protein